MVFNGDGISVLEDKESSGEWLHSSAHDQTVHLQMVEMVNMTLRVCHHNLKRKEKELSWPGETVGSDLYKDLHRSEQSGYFFQRLVLPARRAGLG